MKIIYNMDKMQECVSTMQELLNRYCQQIYKGHNTNSVIYKLNKHNWSDARQMWYIQNRQNRINKQILDGMKNEWYDVIQEMLQEQLVIDTQQNILPLIQFTQADVVVK